MSLSLDKLINPRSVAIVGVSERPEAIGTRVPAWVVRQHVADFGTIFWEIFTERAHFCCA